VAAGATQTWSISVANLEYIRLKAKGHTGNWSALSNEVMIDPIGFDCGGNWYAGGGGEGGGGCGRFCDGALVGRGPTLTSLRRSGGGVDSVGAGENTILNATATGARGVDLVPIEAVQNTVGQYVAHLRVAGGYGSLVDGVKLLLVDHPEDTEAFPCGRRVVTGRRSQVSMATSETGEDVTNLINGSGGILNADSAAAVTIVTPLDAQETPLVIECANGGARGYPIVVETQSQAGWHTSGTVYPRLVSSAVVLDSVPAGPVRLRFTGYAQVSSVSRLAEDASSVTTTWGSLQGAVTSSAGDVGSAIGLEDSLATPLIGPDTLWAAFSAPSAGGSSIRGTFLWVAATPVVAAAARSYAQSRQQSTPVQFALYQNLPNPFSGTTGIRFDLPVGSMVRLEVFDVSGRRVRSLVNHFMPAGHQSVVWDHRDDAGTNLDAGVYFYQLQAGTFRDRRKLVLMP